MSKPKSKEPSEADLVFNRASIALAKNQALVAAWLPPRSEAELANAKSQEELDREEEEMFAPVPELLGVGATVPKDKDGLPQRSSASALDKLRTQLLGKYAGSSRVAKRAGAVPGKSLAQRPANQVPVAQDNSEDDEEEDSRASAIVKKSQPEKGTNRKKKQQARLDSGDIVEGKTPAPESQDEQMQSRDTVRKRPSSFMDTLLEKRSKKKKR